MSDENNSDEIPVEVISEDTIETNNSSVILVDADFIHPNISLNLGFPNLTKNLNSAINGTHPVHSCLYQHNSGLKFVPSSIFQKDYHNSLITHLKPHLIDLSKRKPHAHFPKRGASTNSMAQNNSTNLVVVDSADDHFHTMHTMQASDHVIAVCTACPNSVHDTKKFIEQSNSIGINIEGVIVNQFKSDEFDHSLFEISEKLSKPILGVIPFDNSVRSASKLNHPVVFAHPDSDSASAFRKLAVSLLAGDAYA